MKKYLMCLMALLLLEFPAQVSAQAQDQGPDPGQNQGQDAAQPESSVARVSFIRGDVSTQRGDSGDWNAATLNTPVMAGDRVSTGPNARAEVQLDYANILRLDQNSAANVSNLSQPQLQVQVGQGIASYSMLKGNQAQVEIDTPNAAVHPLKEGQYRIEVTANEVSQILVLRGGADVTTPQGTAHVDAGAMMTVEGTTNPQYRITGARARDEFDKWNVDRDKLIVNAASWRYTNPYYTGTQDLDAYGQWVSAPDYGNVWVPAQGPGWAPYSSGRWVWQPVYGWTWVSYEPWGWAPYHYGRWFVYGNSWAWWPGPVYVGYRPIWAPAYVSFFGFGGWGFGFGFGGWGFGTFGWLPIGPGDWFHPWWGRWGGGRVNITNINIYNNHTPGRPGVIPLSAHGVSNVHSALTNDRVRQGISSMSAKDFGRTSVPSQTRSINAATLRQASAMTGRLPAVPTKDSLRSVDRPASRSTILSRAGDNQHFFTKNMPPATSRTFNQQAAETQKMVDSSRAEMSRSAASNSGSSRSDGRTSTQMQMGRETSSGTQSSGNNSRGSSSPTQNGISQREGWHSFSGQGATGTSRAGQPSQGQSSQKPALNSSTGQAPRGQFTPATPNNASNTPQKGNESGWQSFKPRSSSPSSSTSGASGRSAASGNSARPGWQSFPSSPRSGPSKSAYSRPPLDLHQPIVTQRSSSSYGRNYGGAPRGQGSYRPPSGGGRPGGSTPSPHSSGGHPSGGSGGHSGGGGHH
jgi:hypothetical protein